MGKTQQESWNEAQTAGTNGCLGLNKQRVDPNVLWSRLKGSRLAERLRKDAFSPWRVDKLQEGAEVPDA